MTSYLITFPNLFERAKFEETKAHYFYTSLESLSKDPIKAHSCKFIEVVSKDFRDYSFLLNFPNCKVVRKCIRGKKVHYECINKGL